jgi:hypothetical protein
MPFFGFGAPLGLALIIVHCFLVSQAHSFYFAADFFTRELVARADESEMPEFHRLINFPDHVTRCRVSNYSPPNGRRYCVMCGEARICHAGGNDPIPSNSKAASAHRNGTSAAASEEGYVIPRQNKGVCTMCDVAVWTIRALNLEIKWCKGCKNFRPWPLFGDKVMATKCVRCRDRQKEKYKQKLKSQQHSVP